MSSKPLMDADDIIPILIHHESDEKPSKGLGKKQSYLRFVLKQAESLNKRVILFGDEFNRDWASEWYPAIDYCTDKWERFDKAFVNMSDYTDEWARGIFKRFFIFEEFCSQNNLGDMLILDSDVLLYINASGFSFRNNDLAFEWAQAVDITKPPVELESVVCGIGYFTLEKLKSFTDFCIRVYEEKDSLYFPMMIDYWKLTQENKWNGGVTEMALLYFWLTTQQGVKVINLLEPTRNTTFVNNIMESSNLLPSEYVIDPLTKTKKIRFRNGMPQVQRKVDKEWITVNDIHFAGDTKRFIGDYYRFGKITAYNRIYYVLIQFYRTHVKRYFRKLGLKSK